MSGITQEEIEQAQAREEQGNHDDHCRRDAEAHDAPHEFVLNRRTSTTTTTSEGARASRPGAPHSKRTW